MKWELEDNTQEAFQFLMLGAGIVLAIKALVIGAGYLFDSGTGSQIEQITSLYRANYLLSEKNVIVIGGMELFGRLAVAFLLSIGTGITGSLIGLIIAKTVRRSALSFAVAGARFGLVITGSIVLYSALFLPPSSVVISDQGALFRSRISIADAISIPFTAQEVHVSWSEVRSVVHEQIPMEMQACGIIDRVVLIQNGTKRIFVEGRPQGSNCMEAIAAAQERSRTLIVMLTEEYLRQ